MTLILNIYGFVDLAPFFLSFSGKSTLAFLLQRGVWSYRHDYDVPLVTLILNIYGTVDLTPTIQA